MARAHGSFISRRLIILSLVFSQQTADFCLHFSEQLPRHGSSGSIGGGDLYVGRHHPKWEPLHLADPMRYRTEAATTQSPGWHFTTFPRPRYANKNTGAATIFRAQDRKQYYR